MRNLHEGLIHLCRLALAYDLFLRVGHFYPFGLTDAGLMVWNGQKNQLPEGEGSTITLQRRERTGLLIIPKSSD